MNQNTSLYMGPAKIQKDWWGDSGRWQIWSELCQGTISAGAAATGTNGTDLQYLRDEKPTR